MALPVPRYEDAVALLRSLSGPWGIRASASNHANYGAVFARDAVMAGIAGLLTDDRTVVAGLSSTLGHLRDLQGTEGQVASNYRLADGHPPHVSFGTLVPRLDSPLWYLIGIGLAARAGALDPTPFQRSVHRVVHLLNALEYNGRHLLYVPVGGNWADEYLYEGHVLHDQVLRAWGLRLAGELFDEEAWRTKASRIEATILDAFASSSTERPYPIAAISPIRTHDVFDLATCALLGASGIAPALAHPALDWIDEHYLARGALPPAFHPVIDETHSDWPSLVRYQLHGFRNRPHEYHNGGIWTIWIGWLALALARTGRLDSLARLQEAMATRLTAPLGFAFEEFFHGRTGTPGGTAGMAYSATGIIFLGAAGTLALDTLFAPVTPAPTVSQLAHRQLALALTSAMTAHHPFDQRASRTVIAIAGESGSGKSVTAVNLARELSSAGHVAEVLHQDDYFIRPPATNHAHRVADLGTVGPQEVDFDRLRAHVAAFRRGDISVDAPRVDYGADRFDCHRRDFSTVEVLVVEGTYVLANVDADIRIFLDATSDDTRDRRMARNRDIDAPIVDQVLAIEHPIIAAQRAAADIIIDRDFHIVGSTR